MQVQSHKFGQVAVCCLMSLLLTACAYAENYRFTDVERVVAVSDPHGAHAAFVRTLVAAEIIDTDENWSGGNAHLVITGDLLDRGAESRAIMDLVMQLESQSIAAGGMVHLTLGNHEVMNLVGDLRYVAAGEYAAFASDESVEERENGYQAFRAAALLTSTQPPTEEALRAEFDRTRPPGFFAHRREFSSEGVYGRWLLEKPLIVVVNETAFVHGGLSPLVAEMGLEGLNDTMRSQVADYVRHLDFLVSEGIIDPAVNFYEHGAAVKTALGNPDINDAQRQSLESLLTLAEASVHDDTGPLWYRGTVGCSILSEGDVIDAALAALGADRVVIGHTPTVTRRVLQKFDGRVIEIDTGMLHSSYRGTGNALIIEGDQMRVISEAFPNEPYAIVQHPRRVGARSDGIDVEVLEKLLATGEVIASEIDAAQRQVLTLRGDGGTVKAVYVADSRPKDVNTELAAYRLDRLLRLDMVPVTVAREVDGKPGTLQFLPDNVSDEADRSAKWSGWRRMVPAVAAVELNVHIRCAGLQ